MCCACQKINSLTEADVNDACKKTCEGKNDALSERLDNTNHYTTNYAAGKGRNPLDIENACEKWRLVCGAHICSRIALSFWDISVRFLNAPKLLHAKPVTQDKTAGNPRLTYSKRSG
jgi:hypothetical protein